MGSNYRRILKIGTIFTLATLPFVMIPVAGAVEGITAQTAATSRLKPLSADPIQSVAKPAAGQAFVDPAYGTTVHRATDAADGNGGRMRHEYSRRQAFNANNSRYLAQDVSGAWYLYDAANFRKIEKLEGFAGDCEPLWHPTDPNKIYFTDRNGGTSWWSYDVLSHKKEVLFDFAGKTPWPEAQSFWTKGEGTMSADGRYMALMATKYDEATQENKIYGLLMFDIEQRKIIGTLDANKFPVPNAMPDHISTSPSGKYAVPSWVNGQGGTRAYTHDFSTSVELIPGSEHSDLAFGPNKQDYFVYADYTNGQLAAIDIDTKKRIDLGGLYPASGEGYSLHISGQAFGKPGWAVVSTYADYANYNSVYPSPTLRPEYRKVWLLELKPNGRKLNVTHIRAKTDSKEKDYFLEPQATASRDLSKIIFASDFGGNEVESYIVDVPKGFDS